MLSIVTKINYWRKLLCGSFLIFLLKKKQQFCFSDASPPKRFEEIDPPLSFAFHNHQNYINCWLWPPATHLGGIKCQRSLQLRNQPLVASLFSVDLLFFFLPTYPGDIAEWWERRGSKLDSMQWHFCWCCSSFLWSWETLPPRPSQHPIASWQITKHVKLLRNCHPSVCPM